MILNLTQHLATDDQAEAGVENLSITDRNKLTKLLTFEELPTPEFLQNRAEAIGDLILPLENYKVMIGGAPFFMPVLDKWLKRMGYTVLYAFSKRIVEEKEVGGEVRKISTFKHIGFVESSVLN